LPMLLGTELDTAKISHPSRRVDLTDPQKWAMRLWITLL
jgi:hypothetical protein